MGLATTARSAETTDSQATSPPPPMTAEVLKPIEKITAQMWPAMPVLPSMIAGGTDGRFLTPAGIPTYGVSGLFMNPASTWLNAKHLIADGRQVASVD